MSALRDHAVSLDPASGSAHAVGWQLAAAPWSARHRDGYVFYYPSGFSTAEITLRHHLIGVEFLPNVVDLRLDAAAQRQTVVPAGSTYVVPAGTTVTVDKAHACEYLLITIDPRAETLSPALAARMRERVRNVRVVEAAHALRRALLLGDVADTDVDALIRSVMTGLATDPSLAHAAAAPLPDPRLGRALDHVAEHFGEKIAVEDLARAAGGLSAVRFTHLFSTAFGLSAHQYVLNYRVHHARERLARSDDRIADVAYEAGFCSQAHMTEIFRRRLGVSPSQVRSGGFGAGMPGLLDLAS